MIAVCVPIPGRRDCIFGDDDVPSRFARGGVAPFSRTTRDVSQPNQTDFIQSFLLSVAAFETVVGWGLGF